MKLIKDSSNFSNNKPLKNYWIKKNKCLDFPFHSQKIKLKAKISVEGKETVYRLGNGCQF